MAITPAQLNSGAGSILTRTMLLASGPLGVPIPLAILDVVKEERVDYDAEISDHPVEQGPEITDHIQIKNPTLRLKGTISNTPIDLSVALANLAAGAIAAITTSQARSNILNAGLSEGVGIVGSALQNGASNNISSVFAGSVDAISRTILLTAFQVKQPFSVVTKRFKYDNMVIQKLSFPRNEETGYALEFEMDLRQLTIVTPITALFSQLAEDIISSGSSSTSLGAQSTSLASSQATSGVQSSLLSDSPLVSAKSPSFFQGVA